MSIREQLAQPEHPPLTMNGHGAILHTKPGHPSYRDFKKTVHEAVLDRVDLERLARFPTDRVRQEIGILVNGIIDEEKLLLNDTERRQLTADVFDEMFGFGPLEPLLQDPTVSDILVNTAKQTYVERRGKLELTDITFYDEAHLMMVI